MGRPLLCALPLATHKGGRAPLRSQQQQQQQQPDGRRPVALVTNFLAQLWYGTHLITRFNWHDINAA